jgi:hypothetical protein
MPGGEQSPGFPFAINGPEEQAGGAIGMSGLCAGPAGFAISTSR